MIPELQKQIAELQTAFQEVNRRLERLTSDHQILRQQLQVESPPECANQVSPMPQQAMGYPRPGY